MSLTLKQVRDSMVLISNRTLEALAEGPLPEVDGAPRNESCRVCQALEPLADGINPVIAELLDWHDFTGKSYDLLCKIFRQELTDHDVEEQLVEEVQALVGELSYARCLVIYACAAAELEGRRRDYAERGLDADGEPSDERTPEEQRQDEEADDAERRLGAERIGDL